MDENLFNFDNSYSMADYWFQVLLWYPVLIHAGGIININGMIRLNMPIWPLSKEEANFTEAILFFYHT